MLNRENTIQSLKDNKFKDLGKKNCDIKIQEIPFVKKINLRLDPNDKNQISACSKILGTMLPTKANTYSKNEKVKVIWLGPNEWLIINNDDLFLKLQNEIEDLKEEIATQEEIQEVAEQAQDDMEKAGRIWERDQAKK